ncbi:hypothetical protein PSACC_01104 [Paramicrosporidium saccamoebae]|uniref:Ubiquitin-like protease family profile domain-containing protein n=1 Tax=Paramicrosporidium saccamoebae TaxID=1246581 RepID=A0A2H9TMZ0_9FUNG|nr:hypothetical protein PSACC_01104 [Paramicrosporidium saccamoebae]
MWATLDDSLAPSEGDGEPISLPSFKDVCRDAAMKLPTMSTKGSVYPATAPKIPNNDRYTSVPVKPKAKAVIDLTSSDDEKPTPKDSSRQTRNSPTSLKDDREPVGLLSLNDIYLATVAEQVVSNTTPTREVIDILSSDDEGSQSTPKTPGSITLTLPADLEGNGQFAFSKLTIAAANLLSQLEQSSSKIDLPLLPGEKPSSRREIDNIEFRNLLSPQCVNDQVVSAYFKQLPFFNKTKSSYAIVDPLLSQKMPESFKFEWGKIYLWPLHHVEEFHWTLLVVDLSNVQEEKMDLRHYDSLKSGTRRSGIDPAFNTLKEKLGFKEQTFTYKKMQTPQQKNVVDCGIFTSMIGKQLVLGLPTKTIASWNSDDMRNTMAVELVTMKLYEYE